MMTFFTVFDIPVFWPILLLYFVALLFLTMKRQIRHMIKHKYVERNAPAAGPRMPRAPVYCTTTTERRLTTQLTPSLPQVRAVELGQGQVQGRSEGRRQELGVMAGSRRRRLSLPLAGLCT